jgi:hypothetical protein
MAQCALRLKPTSWAQYISRYDRVKAVGWQLRALCRAGNASLPDAGPDLRLTSGEQIRDVNIYLDFETREPTNVDGTPLLNAIGCLHHDVGVVGGWISLKSNDFSEVWEQVRQGGYSDCFIEITVRPIEFLGEDTGWEWDVVNHQVIYITAAILQFERTAAKKKLEHAKQKRGWFG